MAGRKSRAVSRFAAGVREQLAQEAARLMIEGGIEDFGFAKRKAAERLGVSGAGALPTNAEVAASLAERQRIFEPDVHGERLAALRRLAAQVMAVLEPFQPKLAGPVLDGTATENSVIELHVFADAPEHVAAMLEQQGVAPRNSQRRYRFGGGATDDVPGFSFVHAGAGVEVTVFPERGAHHAPLSPVDGRPMRRAARGAVLSLVER
jgi:hypothetical protein